MTNNEIIENGRRLFQSAENLRQSAPDLDALLESLWEVIAEEELFGEIEDLGDEDAGGDAEWIASAYAYNAAVLSYPERVSGQRGRSKKPIRLGTLTFVVRICNSGDVAEDTANWPWLHQACLIVGWHPRSNHEDTWEIDNFNPNDENLAAIVHVGNGLWAWREDGGNYAYFFALPIFALRNEADLKQHALLPLKVLFRADNPEAAAEDALSNVPALLPISR